MPVVVEVVAEVAVLVTVIPTTRLIRVVLVDFLLDGQEVATPRANDCLTKM